MIVCYRWDQMLPIWEQIEPFIQTALNRGSDWSISDVRQALTTSQAQLWTWREPDITAVMTTTIQDDTCLILTMAGEGLSRWIDSLWVVENWARQNNCTKLAIHGRKGWSRFGFDITGMDGRLYIMERKL